MDDIVPVRAPGTKKQVKRRIRVALADDHPVYREGLRTVLDAPDIEVVGEAANGPEAAAMVRSLEPDVLILDICMPGMDGWGVLRTIKDSRMKTAVLLLTVIEDVETATRAFSSGASAYLGKGSAGSDLLGLVRRIQAGERVLSAETIREMSRRRASSRGQAGDSFDQATRALTRQERQVLLLALKGHSNRRIAEMTDLSLNTIKTHMRSLFAKLKVPDRKQAMIWAVKNGCGPDRLGAFGPSGDQET